MLQNPVNKTHLAWMLITIIQIQIIASRPFSEEGGGQVLNLCHKGQMAISEICRVERGQLNKGL